MTAKETPFELGKAYLIRTVTYFTVGKLKKVVGDFLMLEEASYVADTGRFMNAVKNGSLNEVEPTGTCYVNINSIVDAFPWKHKLPQEQK